jgi:hypothetical protein
MGFLRPAPEGTVLRHLEKPNGDGVFDQDAVRVLVAALDVACQAVQGAAQALHPIVRLRQRRSYFPARASQCHLACSGTKKGRYAFPHSGPSLGGNAQRERRQRWKTATARHNITKPRHPGLRVIAIACGGLLFPHLFMLPHRHSSLSPTFACRSPARMAPQRGSAGATSIFPRFVVVGRSQYHLDAATIA